MNNKLVIVKYARWAMGNIIQIINTSLKKNNIICLHLSLFRGLLIKNVAVIYHDWASFMATVNSTCIEAIRDSWLGVHLYYIYPAWRSTIFIKFISFDLPSNKILMTWLFILQTRWFGCLQLTIVGTAHTNHLLDWYNNCFDGAMFLSIVSGREKNVEFISSQDKKHLCRIRYVNTWACSMVITF